MTAASTPTVVLFDTLLDFSSPHAALGCVGKCGTTAARAVRTTDTVATPILYCNRHFGIFASSSRDEKRLMTSRREENSIEI